LQKKKTLGQKKKACKNLHEKENKMGKASLKKIEWKGLN